LPLLLKHFVFDRNNIYTYRNNRLLNNKLCTPVDTKIESNLAKNMAAAKTKCP